MNIIMKIIRSLEDNGLLIKGVSETFENEAEEKECEFLGILLGTLGISLLGNLSTGKGVEAKYQEEKQWELVKEQLEQMKAWLEQVKIFNFASLFLTNFEI